MIRTQRLSGILSAFVFFAVMAIMPALKAQVLTPVTWAFSQEKVADNEYKLIFKASIDEHWHLYSQFIDDYPNPPATLFSFETVDQEGVDMDADKKGDGFTLIGGVKEISDPIKVYDQNFQKELTFFSNEAIFEQTVKLDSDKPLTIKGSVEFMSCDDSQCLPPTEEEFTFYFNGASAKAAVAPASDDNAQAATPTQTGSEKESSNLWLFFITAFLAGLAAILTPCVFPMIPMTVSFFMNEKESKAKGRVKALVYGISIILIYTIIGIAVAIMVGPEIANLISTHWVPNMIFFLAFLIFSFSFFGAFDITLPSWVVNKADAQADKGGFLGSFFMALTLVLVSFSCTGPIVGGILVESASGELLKPIVGMLGFSLAFALPFTFFAFSPKLLSNLPKSGGWLNTVKVVLGFLELALSLKFLSLADQAYHWHILDREVYLAIWIVIFTLLGVYLLGKLKFSHDSDVKYVGVPRLLLSIVSFAFVIYMIPGMFGAPLRALSGYIPPQQSLDFDINEIVRDNVKTYAGSANSVAEDETCEIPKYSDIMHLPHGLEGYFDYEQALACAKKQNKPLFIDFTGHACVNCREMEARVWSDPRVLKRLREDFVIVALYVDDKLELPEDEWYTSSYDGKVKNTIGKQNADFQITRFNNNAQPYYVILNNDEQPVAPAKAYDLDANNFVDFLDTAIQNFNENKTCPIK